MSMRATDLLGVPLSYRANAETGVVSLTGKLARPGLLLYSASESPLGKPTVVCRSVDVVSSPKYLESVKGSLISADHSFRSIDKGGSGVITYATYADGFVAIGLMLTDPKVISSVKSGTTQLSAGYTYDYESMLANEISSAKQEFAGDWNAINKRLLAANVDRVEWIRAKNLINNHAALVPMGRAGMACAIDKEIMDEQIGQGEVVALEGSVDAAPQADVGVTATEMMMQLLDIVESLKSSLEKAGVAFDTKGFAADRSGYMGSILGSLGIEAKDADLSQAIALTEAYCHGYAVAADAETVAATTETKAVTAVAADESVSEGFVQVTDRTRSAWDKLTGKVNTKKVAK